MLPLYVVDLLARIPLASVIWRLDDASVAKPDTIQFRKKSAMYTILWMLLVVGSIALIVMGTARSRRAPIFFGSALLVLVAAFFAFVSFWGELLWYDAVGYADRFWTVVLTQIGVSFGAAVSSMILVASLTSLLPQRPAVSRWWPTALAGGLGLTWGASQWTTFLRWWHASSADVADPIFGLDVSFYLFSLPFYLSVNSLLWWLSIIAIAAVAVYLLTINGDVRRQLAQVNSNKSFDFLRIPGEKRELFEHRAVRVLLASLSLLLIVLALTTALGCFSLLTSQHGTVAGAGWTDVNFRIPGLLVAAGSLTIIALGFVSIAAFPSLGSSLTSDSFLKASHLRKLVGLPSAGMVGVWFIGLGVLPSLAQWLYVSPNEITAERPYLEHNISLTRMGFGLHNAEEREYPVSEQLTRETLESNKQLLSEIRLWDPRALLATYEQFQEIRLYYEFRDVDIDRYTIEGKYRQVMASPREMEVANLPRKSQTFVNRHFKYTHGYGLTLAPVSDFTEQGLPNLLVKDLPPQTENESLKVRRPEIYYGEHTEHYVVANSQEDEFNYPSGDQNVYTHYEGDGGVQMKNVWRQFIYGWKLGGTRLFFSGYPQEDSRVMFHRQIQDRLETLAPFLEFEQDAYIVLENGRMYWIVDAYTTSDRFPYSERYLGQQIGNRLSGANYVRNSVKAVVDAYSGDVSFYVFEPNDPIIKTWQAIFPGMFRPRNEMPEELQNHIRYPESLLETQGLVYAKYHMTDPDVFYNQEDLWVRATEKYYDSVQPVEPYYVMWEPPESKQQEFILMQPFTPKNRQVLIGWMAGMCDGENYGRLLAYRFPKEKRILGTQQVETKIDQDSYLSGQLTLWDQRGSNVIRGNLLVIPLNGTLLYVEPIYLQAEAAAYPELRLVAVMHNDRLSYAEDFETALEGLFDTKKRGIRTEEGRTGATLSELAGRANQAFENYLQSTGEQDFQNAGQQLDRLSSILSEMQSRTSTAQVPGSVDLPRQDRQNSSTDN